jgi:uncharacterized linocin/CFP29 family protein
MNGREKLPWSADVWKRLDTAVRDEMHRARTAAKFLPAVYVPAKTLTVPSDTIATSQNQLTVDEGATTRINEYWVEFTMTPAQVEHEAALEAAMAHGSGTSTGITLATRAANILAQAEDTIIFQGANAFQSPLFTNPNTTVTNRGQPLDLGLANIVLATPPQQPRLPNPFQIIPVHPASQSGYQGNTVGAVAQAYSILQLLGQYGPYALVLHSAPYADTHTPLPTTLILPADPIQEFTTAGFFGTGTVPPWSVAPGGPPTGGLPPPPPPSGGGGGGSSSSSSSGGGGLQVLFTGILVSIGGNTMDLVRGTLHPEHDVVVAFEQKDINGNYRFRVVERFALRLKDPTAVALLEFLSG